MGVGWITPRSANNPTDLTDGAVAVRAHGRQARQKCVERRARSAEPGAPRDTARGVFAVSAKGTQPSHLVVYLALVAFASNAAAPACDRAAALRAVIARTSSFPHSPARY